jgi:hypothetical protein
MEKAEGQVVRHECVVHKANVPLAAGESLNKYTNSLSSEGSAYIKKQLNLNTLAKPMSAGAYMIEAYSDKCIFDVYKYGGDAPSEYKYYAVKYTRKSDGKFEFKDLSEVERVISFQSKPTMSISKSKEGEEPAKTAKEFAPGWTVKKSESIWSGVL